MIFDQDDPQSQRHVRLGTTIHRDVAAEESRRLAEAEPLEFEEDDRQVRVMPGWLRILRSLVAVALIGTVAFIGFQGVRGWFERQLDPPGEPGEVVELVVPAGASTADIATILQDLEVVPNSTFFRYYARWKGEENFQAGEYSVPVNSSAQEAIDVLKAGPKPQVFDRFQIREGLWVVEMLPAIADQLDNVTVAQLEAALAGSQLVPRYRPDGISSWEGLLFPDTYEVNADASAVDVLRKMSDEFSQVTGALEYGAAENVLNLSAYEVVIVASLIEAETRVAEERPVVASVIYNRLREQWPLGIDASCLYGIQSRDAAALTSEVLGDTENPYACRGRIGLPPTPINSPSRASLEAAIEPDQTDFMYYVLTNPDGTHTFAVTEEEFAEAKAVCVELGLGCG